MFTSVLPSPLLDIYWFCQEDVPNPMQPFFFRFFFRSHGALATVVHVRAFFTATIARPYKSKSAFSTDKEEDK